MTLDDILQDIYTLEDEMRTYERKYGVLSETFYECYTRGEEPPSESWVRDWTAWASAYSIWLRRRNRSGVRRQVSGLALVPTLCVEMLLETLCVK